MKEKTSLTLKSSAWRACAGYAAFLIVFLFLDIDIGYCISLLFQSQ